MATLTLGLLSVIITAGVTLWQRRPDGPSLQHELVTTTTGLLVQLRQRIIDQDARLARLEERVAHLEAENAAYRERFGPLEA